MINKLKIGLLIVMLSIVWGGLNLAQAATGVTYSSDTNVILSGRTYVIKAGSTATTVQATATQLVVTITGSGPFTLMSDNGDTLTNSGSVAITCNSVTTSTVTLTASGTFTPTAVTYCAGPGGSGGLNGGGGGGGGGGNPPASTTPATITVTSVTPTATTISGCDNRTTGFSTVNGLSCSGNTATVTTTTPTVIAGCGSGTSGFSTSSGVSCAGNTGTVTTVTSYNLGTVTLRNGSKGEPVKELQRFLNRFLNLGLVIDGKLGPKTITVIKKWQKSQGLVADGLIGPKTKALMNSLAK